MVLAGALVLYWQPVRSAASQPLDIRIQANAFGNVNPDDVRAVLYSTASEIFRYCPHTQLDGINVYYRSNHPEIASNRGADGRIAIGLSARDAHWAQYSFQFAHEFCHALANYANHGQRTISVIPNANLWLEESLCETASLFSLRAMSRSWETTPPYPAYRPYAPWLNDYVEKRLAKPQHRLPPGMTFSAWFPRNQSGLRKDADERDWDAIIATQCLPIFEADPAGWEAVTFLNLGPAPGRQSLSDRFVEWRSHCPPRLRPFVTKLARVFGVR